MSKFSLDISKFVEKATAAPDLVVRKVATDLLTNIVKRTPVDTGRARASWIIGLNRFEGPTQYTATDKNGNRTVLQGMARLSDYKPGDTVYIGSRLPYILPLEFGHSNQAPVGMVRISVAEWQTYVDKAVRSLPK